MRKQNGNSELLKCTPVFKVFKQGMTTEPITILKKSDEPFDEKAKRNKYIELGYTILEIDIINKPNESTHKKTASHKA